MIDPTLDRIRQQHRDLLQAETLALAAYYLPGFGRPDLAAELNELARQVMIGAVTFDVMAALDPLTPSPPKGAPSDE